MAQEQKDTPYIVIEKVKADDGREAWAVINEMNDDEPVPVMARSDTQAIKAAIRNETKPEAEGDEALKAPPDEYRDGTFKAISTRNWKGGLTNANQTVRQPTFAEID